MRKLPQKLIRYIFSHFVDLLIATTEDFLTLFLLLVLVIFRETGIHTVFQINLTFNHVCHLKFHSTWNMEHTQCAILKENSVNDLVKKLKYTPDYGTRYLCLYLF